MMLSCITIKHTLTLKPGTTYAAGEEGGGLALGWVPAPAAPAFAWTSVSDSAGLTTYLFRDFRDAVTARQLAEECEGIGPKAAATLLGRFGAQGLARAVQAGDRSAFAGMDVGPKKFEALKKFFEGQVIEDAPQAVSDQTLIMAGASLGFSAEEVRKAIAGLRANVEPVNLGTVVARIREVRAKLP